jgi:hypothetical protein
VPDAWYFDWVSFWLLNGVFLWDGVQRVPAGAWVLRHPAGYPWHVAHGPTVRTGRRLVSWLSPLVCHVVLAPGPGAGRTPPAHLGRWVALLRLPAAVVFAAIVVGVPLLSASMGFLGLVYALAAAFGGALVTALLSMLVLWRMGVPARTAARHAFGTLSPFAAPRAPEMVLARALEGVAFLDAVRFLLPPDEFAGWARPLAYDLSRGDDGVAADGLLPAGDVRAILRHPPPGSLAGDVYCARCGRVYLPSATACRACEGVELVTVTEAAIQVAPAVALPPTPALAGGPPLAAAPASAMGAPRRKSRGKGSRRNSRH